MENAPAGAADISSSINELVSPPGVAGLPKAMDCTNSVTRKRRCSDLADPPPSPPNASESCRLRIVNLPKFYGMAELKKYFVTKLGVSVKQIKPVKDRVRGNMCFVTFSNEQSMQTFQDKIDTFMFKGKTLKAHRAEQAPNKFYRAVERNLQRQPRREQSGPHTSSQAVVTQPSIVEIVAPLHCVPYDPEQLRIKQHELLAIWKKYGELFKNKAQSSMPWLDDALKQNNGLLCELRPVIALPYELTKNEENTAAVSATERSKCLFRNKCEFSFGFNAEKNTDVGFRVAKYRQGNLEVEFPDKVPFISPAMKFVVQLMRKFLLSQTNPLSLPFDEVLKTGHYRQLTVRENRRGHLLVALYMHPQGLTSEQVDAVANDLRKHFTNSDDKVEANIGAGIDARPHVQCLILITASGNMPSAMVKDSAVDATRILFGSGYIEEELLGLSFRISHSSFFQTNAYGAENLYKTILAACLSAARTNDGKKDAENYSVMLDLCCGTGTISLLAAKNVPSLKRIIGIELNADAVRDAVHNAECNGLHAIDSSLSMDTTYAAAQETQLQFIAATVESALPTVAVKIGTSDDISAAPPRAVAVLDPPRSGVQMQVIDALRKCDAIERIIYAACAPSNEQVMQNFYRLCRSSRDSPGEAFRPTYAVPVDLFPYTKHCELVVVFDRYRPATSETSEDTSANAASVSAAAMDTG